MRIAYFTEVNGERIAVRLDTIQAVRRTSGAETWPDRTIIYLSGTPIYVDDPVEVVMDRWVNSLSASV